MEQKDGQTAVASIYTVQLIKEKITDDLDRLLIPWMTGRPKNYTLDLATKYTIAVGYWLDEELTRIGCCDADRRTQCWKFNRHSRTYDIFETAVECMNDVVNGTVEQNRRGHRRWG